MTTPETKSKAVPEAKIEIVEKSLYEKHRKVYARATSGKFNSLRWIFVLLTQVIFYVTPWLQWNNRQALLFDLAERKFYIFGLILWPQDVIYLSVILLLSAFGLFLFTAVAGRLFCGYACPQTVYTEIFMWIENKIEGDRNARIKLDKSSMSARKLRLKATKFFLWGVLSFWTGVTFVGYFMPIHDLMGDLITLTISGWSAFWVFFYGAFCFLQAGFMREQVCKYMCPYARFQGVMFDPDTLIVTYDEARGEPRGARRKTDDSQTKGLGDCVDCKVCVQVCPTGIDIRNGLQYECIGCGLCIDACNDIMAKMDYPPGLIRYATENSVGKHYTSKEMLRHVMRPRIMLYTGILLLIAAAFVYSLSTRIPLRVDVLRDRGVMSREVGDGLTENVYLLHVMNMQDTARTFKVTPEGMAGIRLDGTDTFKVEALGNMTQPINVRVASDIGHPGANQIRFVIVDTQNPDIQRDEKSTFIQPN
ncbi:MAG: cytochrome c oxidase accessory protein CcoG [Fluviibacter sp.]